MIVQTLNDLNELLSDKINFLAYLQFHKLIISELKCPKCKNLMSFYMENYMFQCNKTNQKSKRRCPRMHYLAGPAPGANIVKKSIPWGPQYCAPDFNIAPLVA